MIFLHGSESNWNRDDDLQPAIGITASFSNNRETNNSARQLGFSPTDFDTDLCALASTANQVQLFLNQNQVPHMTILSTNPAAIQAITNLHPHSRQSFSHKFYTMLTQILSAIKWCPSEASIASCIHLARDAATTPFSPNHRELNTIAFGFSFAGDGDSKSSEGGCGAGGGAGDRKREDATTPFSPNHRESNTIAFQKASSRQLAISA